MGEFMMIDNAVWIASIFGPFLVIIGLWMLLYSGNFMKVVASVKATVGVFYLTGFINLLLGIFILREYNDWQPNLSFVVTLLGWAFVLRGLMVLFMPHLLIKMTMTKRSFLKGVGIVPLAGGVLLCWLAYFG